MAPTRQGRKIVIVGASGNIGSPTLSALLSHGIHNITVIVRPESTSTFPPGVVVKKGALDDASFLEDAMRQNDVLVLQLPINRLAFQEPLIRAASRAGIRYVLPTEFGSDPNATKLVETFDLLAGKRAVCALVAELGMRWIAVVTNPWYDFNLAHGNWGIDIRARKATLWSEGGRETKISTTTLRRAGEATAALLALPESEFAAYGDGCFYVASFTVSQREMLESTMRVTGTSGADWDVTSAAAVDVVAACDERLAKGDMTAFFTKFFCTHFREGFGGDFSGKAVELEVLGLEREDLDTATAEIVKALR